jgi:uncharacterized protein (TIGR04141 family)
VKCWGIPPADAVDSGVTNCVHTKAAIYTHGLKEGDALFMTERVKKQRLAVFLLTDDIEDLHDALKLEENWKPTETPVDSASGLDGTFFYASKPASPPLWVNFIKPVLTDTLDSIKTSSASGLLLLRVDNRVFAVTFGYGRSMLNPEKIEPQFGLKVCLNRIDPSQMKSMETKTY